MTCKHCGAKQIDTKEFECGTKTYGHIRGEACYEAEIEKLSEKKAEGLTWEDQNLKHGGKSVIAECIGGWMRISYSDDQAILIERIDCKTKLSKWPTLDAAKAHAEELHQQAWRELRARWDKK